MKKIVVIGCSNSTGEETRDWELDPDYYEKTNVTHQERYDAKRGNLLHDYFKKHPDKVLTEDPTGFYDKEGWDEQVRLVQESTGNDHWLLDMSWANYSDQYSWPSLLDNNEEYEVYNFSTRGAGLAYFELAYNIPRIPREYDRKGRHIQNGLYKPVKKFAPENHVYRDFYSPTRNFKELCDTADLLIWQFTNEPRYGLTFNIEKEMVIQALQTDLTGFMVYGSSHESLQSWFPNYLEGNQLKHMQEHFKYYYDNTTNFARSLTWIEQLMQLREDRGLANMIFPIHRVFTSRLGFDAINTVHTRSYGFDDYENPDSGACPGVFIQELGIAPYDILFTSKPSPEQYCAKFTHPSEKGHKTLAGWVHKTITEDYFNE